MNEEKQIRKPSKRKDYIPNAVFHEEMLKWRLMILEDSKAPVPEILAKETKKGYVENIELYRHFVIYRKNLLSNPNARMPEFIGKAILDIANGFIKYYKFNRYSWKDDMVDDAIYVCVKGAKGFDDAVYTNPHAYLTMFCERAFLQRIKKEKREHVKRYKHFISEIFDLDMVDNNKIDYNFYIDMNNKVSAYEKTLKKNQKPSKEKYCTYDLPEDIKTTLEDALNGLDADE